MNNDMNEAVVQAVKIVDALRKISDKKEREKLTSYLIGFLAGASYKK